MKIVLSIAGFDPSGCAGILADTKTIEANGGYCIAVNTANTIQNDVDFTAVNWISDNQIFEQYRILKQRFTFEVVKIGLVKDFFLLQHLVDKLITDNSNVKIIWDPILKASAGFEFHSQVSDYELIDVFKKIYLITPNLDELKAMFPNLLIDEAGKHIAQYCNVLVKGGHDTGFNAIDVLYSDNQVNTFTLERHQGFSKRGTGCVMSSAIAANLVTGKSLYEACLNAKKYVTNYITSNKTLIGEHDYMKMRNEELGNENGSARIEEMRNENDSNQFPDPLCSQSLTSNFSTPHFSISNLHYITQETDSKSHIDMVRDACEAGANWIQLRVKDKPMDEWLKLACETREICSKHNVIFIVNDNVTIAKESRADGVHLGKSDMSPTEARKILGSGFIIGGTANTIDDIERLAAAGVDYIGLGPFRFTETKKNLSPILGFDGYKSILKQMHQKNINTPIIAIGGIELDDVSLLKQTGVLGIAISSAISKAQDKSALIDQFNKLLIP